MKQKILYIIIVVIKEMVIMVLLNTAKKNLTLVHACKGIIIHDTVTFDLFYKDFIKINLEKYNMNYKKFKKFYIRALFKSNQCQNNINVEIIFKNKFNKFNKNLELSNNEICKENFIALGPKNNIDIL